METGITYKVEQYDWKKLSPDAPEIIKHPVVPRLEQTFIKPPKGKRTIFSLRRRK